MKTSKSEINSPIPILNNPNLIFKLHDISGRIGLTIGKTMFAIKLFDKVLICVSNNKPKNILNTSCSRAKVSI